MFECNYEGVWSFSSAFQLCAVIQQVWKRRAFGLVSRIIRRSQPLLPQRTFYSAFFHISCELLFVDKLVWCYLMRATMYRSRSYWCHSYLQCLSVFTQRFESERDSGSLAVRFLLNCAQTSRPKKKLMNKNKKTQRGIIWEVCRDENILVRVLYIKNTARESQWLPELGVNSKYFDKNTDNSF